MCSAPATTRRDSRVTPSWSGWRTAPRMNWERAPNTSSRSIGVTGAGAGPRHGTRSRLTVPFAGVPWRMSTSGMSARNWPCSTGRTRRRSRRCWTVTMRPTRHDATDAIRTATGGRGRCGLATRVRAGDGLRGMVGFFEMCGGGVLNGITAQSCGLSIRYYAWCITGRDGQGYVNNGKGGDRDSAGHGRVVPDVTGHADGVGRYVGRDAGQGEATVILPKGPRDAHQVQREVPYRCWRGDAPHRGHAKAHRGPPRDRPGNATQTDGEPMSIKSWWRRLWARIKGWVASSRDAPPVHPVEGVNADNVLEGVLPQPGAAGFPSDSTSQRARTTAMMRLVMHPPS